MRVTEPRLVTHIGNQFKCHWLIKRKRKIYTHPVENVLKSKGIEVVEAKDVLRPAVIEEPYVPHDDDIHVVETKTPCYIFKNSFTPVEHVEQCQLLTNSVVFDSLPQSILEKVKEPTKEDEEIVKSIILNTQVLDGSQEFIPHGIDVTLPGYHPPRKYGIRNERKISSFLHQMLIQAEWSSPNPKPKRILEEVTSRITLNHSDRLMHNMHEAAMMACVPTPLPPLAGKDEVQAKVGTPLPDIYPLSPFINCRAETQYDLHDGFAVPGARLAPHTVCVGSCRYFHKVQEGAFYGLSLLHAFTHAMAYVKERNKDVLNGDLETPITVNVVHTDGQSFHLGCFQLNTLDPNGQTRNFFWHEPWTQLFTKAGFDCAKPLVDDVNARPLSLLRAIY